MNWDRTIATVLFITLNSDYRLGTLFVDPTLGPTVWYHNPQTYNSHSADLFGANLDGKSNMR